MFSYLASTKEMLNVYKDVLTESGIEYAVQFDEVQWKIDVFMEPIWFQFYAYQVGYRHGSRDTQEMYKKTIKGFQS